jgi:DNA mismatch repair protein MutL
MTIKILSQNVASKIAAGEVVERPLSVVKELMENAIDAQAGEIRIRIENAGQSLIQVEDNGVGIPQAEAGLALQRYATSKISGIDDLERIKTLGFRGEALASIAAVSRFELFTRSGLESVGVRLTSEGGEAIHQEPAGLKEGTRIVVEDLFFNVPARRKFLKSEQTERRNIIDLVSRYALFYAGIRFHLQMEGKEVLATNGNGDRREVLSRIYDVQTARAMLELKVVDDFLGIEGFISPTGISRSNRKEIFFFINGRLISDTALVSAVTQAYQNLLMVGRYPLAMISLTIEPAEVDVNVHPTKAEVRFREPGRIFSLVHSAVRKTVSAFSGVPSLPPTFWLGSSSRTAQMDPAWSFAAQASASLPESQPFTPSAPEDMSDQAAEPTLVRVPLLRLVGQIGRTYLVAEGPDGLYLIDQHAAHERVLFERFRSLQAQNESQYLLEPVVVEIPGRLDKDLANQVETLNHLGFKAENFGPSTYRITAIPLVISHFDPGEAFLSALEEDEEDESLVESALEDKLITRICKRAAVKGGQVLSNEEQERLIRDLENCQSPRTCPHGRPTMIHLSVDLLERQFGRRGSR